MENLSAQLRNELHAKPIQAAFASGPSFTVGGELGSPATKIGGSYIKKAVVRKTFWGTAVINCFDWYLFGVNLA